MRSLEWGSLWRELQQGNVVNLVKRWQNGVPLTRLKMESHLLHRLTGIPTTTMTVVCVCLFVYAFLNGVFYIHVLVNCYISFLWYFDFYAWKRARKMIVMIQGILPLLGQLWEIWHLRFLKSFYHFWCEPIQEKFNMHRDLALLSTFVHATS